MTRNSKGGSRQPCLTPSTHIQWLSLLSSVYHLCGETLIENSDDASMPQQPPQNISADTVEGLFKIHQVDVQGGLPLDTLL